jgi:hypothetical protein
MMRCAKSREHNHHVAEVAAWMRRWGLSVNDLIEIGGEDLRAGNPIRVEKARRVERCWSLMAKLGVDFRDFEDLALLTPDKSAPRRRHRVESLQPIEITNVFVSDSIHGKSTEINDLANSRPVDASEDDLFGFDGGHLK